MKKFYYFLVAFIALFYISCSNEDIKIDIDGNVNDVNITVSLSNFYQSYNYNDTYHDIQVSEYFRTFNSEYDWYIQSCTLIYDENGVLVDKLLNISTNTNAITNSMKLAEGKYTIVSTLTFAFKKDDGSYESMWDLKDEGNLTTATLEMYLNQYLWSIMSYDARQTTVSKGQTTNVNMQPSPVGALAYFYLGNFWCKNESDYPNVSDNGIRSLALYCRNKAVGYKLNPNAVDKFSYLDATSASNWYYLSDNLTPQTFSEDWTFFQSNLYDYFYILDPNPHIEFGYKLEGDDGFTGYGENSYYLTTGKVYLAYWDYFQVGNPYFGLADNNHWNSYGARGTRSVQSGSKALSPGLFLRRK